MKSKFLISFVFLLLAGCSYFNYTAKSDETPKSKTIIDTLETKPPSKVSNSLVDSLKQYVRELEYKNDSLRTELEVANNRIAINKNFVIPDTITFAGRIFKLNNERIYSNFQEIFEHELKSAPRFIPRSGYYFPYFDSVFTAMNVPLDAKYLAIAESALLSLAKSHAGAAGIWQFIPSTAKGYGMKINSFVDERGNIFKSTTSAAKYLKNSYRRLQKSRGVSDWLLAMCSYNAGLGSIYKIIDQQGGDDFFNLIMRVDETNKYVWRAVAIKMIFQYEEEIFGKKLERKKSMLETTKQVEIVLKGHHKIDAWAQAQGTTVRKIWELNPWIKIYKTQRRRYSPLNDVVLPPGEYTILLPKKANPKQKLLARENKKLLQKNNGFFKTHIVKRGDTLYDIAKKYRTSIGKIKRLNNINGSTIYPGQKLKLTGSATTAKNRYYVVKKGDSLSKIAGKLNASTKRLIQKNNLRVRKKSNKTIVMIYPGQKLYY